MYHGLGTDRFLSLPARTQRPAPRRTGACSVSKFLHDCYEWLPVIRKPGGSENPKRRPSQETPQATPQFPYATSCHKRSTRDRRPISLHPGLPGRAPRIREHELETNALVISDREGTTQGNAGLSLPFEGGMKRGHNAGPALHPEKEGARWLTQPRAGTRGAWFELHMGTQEPQSAGAAFHKRLTAEGDGPALRMAPLSRARGFGWVNVGCREVG